MLAHRLTGWSIAHLYTSDLERAKMTAAVIGKTLNLSPVIDPVWRERNIGVFEGLTGEEIQQRFPEVWNNLHTGSISGIAGAESTDSILNRAKMGCQTLLTHHPDETVVVVSHGGMIQAILVHLLELAPEGFSRLVGGGHTAISQVTIHAGHARLVRLNDAAHLELMSDRFAS
jgi:broad specificity phosphatase PhoE